jgi:glycosyltransferase involved in cell wall biosynthesis
LPFVAPAADRIPMLVEPEREGVLYDPAAPGALAGALDRLRNAAVRQRLGAAARARAVRDYSWTAHCRALESAMLRVRAAQGDARGARARPA